MSTLVETIESGKGVACIRYSPATSEITVGIMNADDLTDEDREGGVVLPLLPADLDLALLGVGGAAHMPEKQLATAVIGVALDRAGIPRAES